MFETISSILVDLGIEYGYVLFEIISSILVDLSIEYGCVLFEEKSLACSYSWVLNTGMFCLK